MIEAIEKNYINQEDNLYLDIDGFEGPIDLLLSLAREQKLDLIEISVFELAKQYINYINIQVDLKIDIAADYLVMASWLAYLKSKLLLPSSGEEEDEEYSAEELASQLSHRIRRLEAMKIASFSLFDRPIINRDVYLRGMPEEIDEIKKLTYQTTLFDLIKSYIEKQDSYVPKKLHIYKLNFFSIDNARVFLSQIFNKFTNWINFINIFKDISPMANKKTNIASSFSVLLDLVSEQKIKTKQETVFGDIYIKENNKNEPVE